MKKYWFFLSFLCVIFPCKKIRAQLGDKVKIGVSKKIALGNGFDQAIESPFTGLFFNVEMSKCFSFDFEWQKNILCSAMSVSSTENQRAFYNGFYKRDWSASLEVNYRLKPIDDKFTPFIGLGAGEYYLYDSKVNIKEGKEDPQNGSIDYDMRKYFKRSGVFGSVGIKYNLNTRTTLFINGKCSVLFDKKYLIMSMPGNYSDFLNLSTGVRFSFN